MTRLLLPKRKTKQIVYVSKECARRCLDDMADFDLDAVRSREIDIIII